MNHESYSFPYNDIALIRLGQALTFTDRVRAACLPDAPVSEDGFVLDVVGFGKESTQETSLTLNLKKVVQDFISF